MVSLAGLTLLGELKLPRSLEERRRGDMLNKLSSVQCSYGFDQEGSYRTVEGFEVAKTSREIESGVKIAIYRNFRHAAPLCLFTLWS